MLTLRRPASALLVLLAPLLPSCGDESSDARRVHIVSGAVVYNGRSVTVALDLHVDAAHQAAKLSWRVGAVPDHPLCGAARGWRLDVSEPPTDVAANTALDLHVHATSGDRPTCAPEQSVARCGDSVTLLLMAEDDDVLAALDTTYVCLCVAHPVR